MLCCSTYGRTAAPHPQFRLSSLNWPTGNFDCTSWYACRAIPNCLRLFVHLLRDAASRTFWTAGSRRPIRMAMIAITTSSSIRVNARRDGSGRFTGHLTGRDEKAGRAEPSGPRAERLTPVGSGGAGHGGGGDGEHGTAPGWDWD